MAEMTNKFKAGERYFSDDNRDTVVVSRSTNYIRAEIGFGMSANYKIHIDTFGREWIKAKGHVFIAKWR